MHHRVVIVFAVLISFASLQRQADAQVHFAPIISFEAGYPLSLERSPGIINRFGTKGTGSSQNYLLGFGVAASMPLSATFSFSPALEYRYSFGGFKSDSYSSTGYTVAGLAIATKNYFEVTSAEHRIDILAPIVWSLNKTSVDLGLWGALDLSRSIEGTEYIISPDSARFVGGGTSNRYASGDTIGASHFHYGLEAGVGYKFRLSSSLALEPKFYLRIDISALSDAPSKAFSSGISFSLIRHSEAPITEPKIADTINTKPDVLVAITTSIHFTKNGIRLSAQTPVEIAGYNTYYLQYTELPSILMDINRYKLLSAEEAESFSPAELSRKELSEYERQELNLIGYRLKKNHKAILELHNEEAALSEVGALEHYFIDKWHISTKQFHKQITKGTDETISIADTDPSILAPAASQWIERSYSIPHMGLEKSIVAEAGVRSWKVTVTQGATTLTTFSSNGDGAIESNIADFDLASDTSSVAPLIATLQAEDFSGNTAMSHDTLILPSSEELKRTIHEREAIVFIFLPHEENELRALEMKKLISSIKPVARITISEPRISSTNTESKTIAEDIISRLKPHPELSTEVRIAKRAEEKDDSIYRDATIVKIEQEK